MYYTFWTEVSRHVYTDGIKSKGKVVPVLN
jgi:hypothetical protein